jgi:hypothetical protein
MFCSSSAPASSALEQEASCITLELTTSVLKTTEVQKPLSRALHQTRVLRVAHLQVLPQVMLIKDNNNKKHLHSSQSRHAGL